MTNTTTIDKKIKKIIDLIYDLKNQKNINEIVNEIDNYSELDSDFKNYVINAYNQELNKFESRLADFEEFFDALKDGKIQ